MVVAVGCCRRRRCTHTQQTQPCPSCSCMHTRTHLHSVRVCLSVRKPQYRKPTQRTLTKKRTHTCSNTHRRGGGKSARTTTKKKATLLAHRQHQGNERARGEEGKLLLVVGREQNVRELLGHHNKLFQVHLSTAVCVTLCHDGFGLLPHLLRVAHHVVGLEDLDEFLL